MIAQLKSWCMYLHSRNSRLETHSASPSWWLRFMLIFTEFSEFMLIVWAEFAHFGLAWTEGQGSFTALVRVVSVEIFWARFFELGILVSFFEFFWAECGNECVRKVQIERELEELGWAVSLWGRSQREFCVIRTGGMHGPPRLQGRQACLPKQGSIHTGIVLNPAGSCAVRHEPYVVSDCRVAS